MNTYSIFGLKSQTFGPPMLAALDIIALDQLKDHQENYSDSPLKLYPQDYQLFKLGKWDWSTARYTDERELICNLSELDQKIMLEEDNIENLKMLDELSKQ